MLGLRRSLRGWIATAALAASGSLAALAATPTADGWTADPEEQFLLDVNIRQLKLGGGVRAYNTPTGPCVVLGDFLKALDLPIKVDLAGRKASGWAFRESHHISIDVGAAKVSYGRSSEALKPSSIRETPEGWCADAEALARWFAIGVKPDTSASTLLLESEAKLPVELAMEREKRAAALMTRTKFDLASAPKVKLPYRMWRSPALDFVVNAGMTYRARDGARVDRRSAVYAAGEIAHLSYDAQIGTDHKGRPNMLRFRTYRSDPAAGLLGPLKATHVGFGDVEGFGSRLTGSPQSGRGAVLTNRPVHRTNGFGRTRFEGDLPTGWEAEIYSNGELIALSRATADQRYVFDDVELRYGDNEIRIVLYGPQGQIRTHEELINVGQDNVPAGKTWYWAGLNQPGRDALVLGNEKDQGPAVRGQATVSVEHGLNERTSVGALARTLLLEDERLTFVEGTIRRSIGGAAAEVSIAYESSGGRAIGAEVLGRLGPVHLRADALVTSNFHARGAKAESLKDVRLSADVPIRIGKAVIPARAAMRLTDGGDGTRRIEGTGRISTAIGRVNLATDLRYRRQSAKLGQPPPDELDWSFIGSGRVGDVRLRGISTFRILPEKKLERVELSGYWNASDRADWEGGVVYDLTRKRANARLSHVRRMESFGIALTAEAASDRSVAVGASLNFSLNPGRFALSRQPLAGAGSVYARVFRDLNDNGVHDKSEPLEPDVMVTTGLRLTDRKTRKNGGVTIGGLTAYQPVAISVDQTTLSDPSLTPRQALQVVVPRPGVSAEVEIALVAAGAIEGALMKSGEVGFEGVDLELVDAAGKVVATSRSDFDGFFLFDRVPYGKYKIRIAQASADAARLVPLLLTDVTLGEDKPILRLGTIDAQPLPQIAALSP